MHNPMGQSNDHDAYGQQKYQPPPLPEDDFMSPHPSLYPASHQYHEQHRQQQQQQVVGRPNTIELNNSYGAAAMPLPAPAFQYNPTQV